MAQFWCFSGARYNPASVSAAFIIKASVVLAAIVLLARRSVRAHHPFPRFGPANQVTMVRAFFAAVAAGFIGEPSLSAGWIVGGAAAVATVLDGVDGWLARRADMASAFGARFDMEIDALLIQTLAILVWQHGKAGAWVLASGLIRYVFVAAGRVWPWLRGSLAPTLRGRAICVVQLTALIAAILPRVQPPPSAWIAGTGLAVLCYSFFVDTLRLWQQR
jgi:phosphatidylglycerophosphate synthase